MRWIEVTCKFRKTKMFINLAKVIRIEDSMLFMRVRRRWYFRKPYFIVESEVLTALETYEEIKQKIKEAR